MGYTSDGQMEVIPSTCHKNRKKDGGVGRRRRRRRKGRKRRWRSIALATFMAYSEL